MPKFVNDKDCRILLDWILSHDSLTLRDIENHLYIMGFGFPSNLASCYAFFVSVYHDYKDNVNFDRVLLVLRSLIITQFMEFYNFYPCIGFSDKFSYSSRLA